MTKILDIMTGLLKADKERLLRLLVSLCESLRPADLLLRCDQLKNATQLKAMEKELRGKYPLGNQGLCLNQER